ncbi:MAG: ferrochelatase [Deltaproteobacteria bacterium]|nr:ferrochelatase [Deltaproteobacteria bacterium]
MARARSSPSSSSRAALDPHVAELLGATDTFLAGRTRWQTLAPRGGAPRSLVALAELLLPTRDDRPALHDQQAIAWAMALSDLARAIAREFPENLFADLDHVASELRRVVATRGHVALERTIDPLVRIHRSYGKSSRIRFRYVHDFLYGFDWARWVARDPQARRTIGNYDLPFLAHVEKRALELDALVEANDPSYPPLAPGEFRNPFPFDREPAAESELFRSLAEADLLPIRAFDADRPQPSADRPFTSLREQRAQAMGLSGQRSR